MTAVPDSCPTELDVLASAVRWCAAHNLGSVLLCDAIAAAEASGWDRTQVPSVEQVAAKVAEAVCSACCGPPHDSNDPHCAYCLLARAERAEAQLATVREVLARVAAAEPGPYSGGCYADCTSETHEPRCVEWDAASDAARHALADTSAAAEAYRASVEAPLRAEIEQVSAFAAAQEAAHQRAHDATEAERDALAAALAEMREAADDVVCDPCPFHDEDDCDETCRDGQEHARLRAALAALPTNLAAERDRRAVVAAAIALEDAAKDDIHTPLSAGGIRWAAGLLRSLADPSTWVDRRGPLFATYLPRAADERGAR